MSLTLAATGTLMPPEVRELGERVQRHDVDCAAGRVVWRTLGQGRPLVLLHGGHGSWLHWVRNVAELAADRAVWVPEMPGYGDSGISVDDSMAGLVQGLQQSLEQLLGRDADVDLVGFSFGGLVASHLAAVRGGVKRLVLLGAVRHGGMQRPRAELRNWREAALRGDESALDEAMHHNLLAQMLQNSQSVDATAMYLHSQCVFEDTFSQPATFARRGAAGAIAAFV